MLKDIRDKRLWGDIFDIGYNKRGFYVKDKEKTIRDLPVVSLRDRISKGIIADSYTGESLRKLIKSSDITKYKWRWKAAMQSCPQEMKNFAHNFRIW